MFYLCVVSSRLTYPLRHPRQILQFPAVKMSDSYLDKTKVVSVIYYSHNSSRYISPVCAVSGPLPVNITRHIELCMLCYLLIYFWFHLRCFAKQRMTEFGVWTISIFTYRIMTAVSGCVGARCWQGGGVSIIVFGCPSKCQGRHSTYSTLST